jgi:hypothetical protein
LFCLNERGYYDSIGNIYAMLIPRNSHIRCVIKIIKLFFRKIKAFLESSFKIRCHYWQFISEVFIYYYSVVLKLKFFFCNSLKTFTFYLGDGKYLVNRLHDFPFFVILFQSKSPCHLDLMMVTAKNYILNRDFRLIPFMQNLGGVSNRLFT